MLLSLCSFIKYLWIKFRAGCEVWFHVTNGDAAGFVTGGAQGIKPLQGWQMMRNLEQNPAVYHVI